MSPIHDKAVGAAALLGLIALAVGVEALARTGTLHGFTGQPRHILVCLMGGGLLAARAWRHPREAVIWGPLAVGGLLQAGGLALRPAVAATPHPLAGVAVLVGLTVSWLGGWRLARARVEGASGYSWLDPGLTVAWSAAACVFTLSSVEGSNDEVVRRILVGAVIPGGAVALACLPLVAASMTRDRLRLRDWLLSLGFAGVAVAHISQAVTGLSPGAGTGDLVVDLVIELHLLLLAAGAWAPRVDAARVKDDDGTWWQWVPTLQWLLAGGVTLVVGALTPLPTRVVVLAALALVAAAIRTFAVLHQVRTLVGERAAAYTDDLTGLPNRRALQAELELLAADRSAPGGALVVLGLDGFRSLNDTLGHLAGDKLLLEVAQRLAPVLGDERLARLAGDEFGVLLRRRSDAEATAAAMRAALQDPMELDGITIAVQASVGYALLPEDARRPGELIRRADVALTDAKRRRVGIARYAPERDTQARQHLELAADLRRALAGEPLGLWVAFQPQVDLEDGVCRGVEALIRWEHPVRGPISPADLLPVAESTGQMAALTDKVLDVALTEAARLAEAGRPLRVGVNVSAVTLVDLVLPERIAAALGRHAVVPSRLVVEVTEDAVMSDETRCLAVLDRIAGLGVEISIDDFGTGQSSLSQLRHLPAQELKIDRSFVQGMAADPLDAEVVRLVVAMGNRMGLRVVAEGIEADEERAALAALGCHVVQGYAIGRPMPADQLHRFLAEADASGHLDVAA